MIIIYTATVLILVYVIRVSFYLLWLYIATEETIKDSVLFEKQSKKNIHNALFIGDSLTYGVGASDPNNSIAGLFYSDNTNFNIQNRSVNKCTTRDLYKRIKKFEKTEYVTNICVLSIGGNDIVQLRSMIGIGERIKYIVEVLDSRSDDVYIFTPTKPGKTPFIVKLLILDRVKKLRKIVQSLENNNIHHVDMWEAGDMLLAEPKKYFVKDTIHLSDAGQVAWYTQLKKSMMR